MATAHSTAVPAPLARRPLRTFRPQDAVDVYAHPRPELARLVRRGVLHRAAPGYYIVTPPEQAGRIWIPNLEAAAAGIAASIYGPDDAIVMGISAARLHHAIPRALATAVVAVPGGTGRSPSPTGPPQSASSGATLVNSMRNE